MEVAGNAVIAVARGPRVDSDAPLEVEAVWNPLGQRVWTVVTRLTATTQSRVTAVESMRLEVPALGNPKSKITYYSSSWGAEFEPHHRQGGPEPLALEVRSGRSSHGYHPWIGIETPDGQALIATLAWSGNWSIVAQSGELAVGLNPWRLEIDLKAGEVFETPHVIVALGDSLVEAASALQTAVREDWMPRTPWSDAAPFEWNHWWPYEDRDITHDAVVDNARDAAELGIEVVTVDAGWFGPADHNSDWQHFRGDWTHVNTQRFPDGLEALGSEIRSTGAKPGVWLEPEAIGRDADLRSSLPEAVAQGSDPRATGGVHQAITVSLDDAEGSAFLGYICLGNSLARQHAIDSMRTVVDSVGARWLKLDFNVDPGFGCTRTDHGHGAGDGLIRHYQGLYWVLDEFRRTHPHVIVEACASGGLRLDLGIAKHVHCLFLSDPDYTEHHLQTLWAASRMLPPLGILHWSHSQWRGDMEPQQCDWAQLSPERFDLMLRAASLHRSGVSLKLGELRDDLQDRLRAHVSAYRRSVAPLLATAVFEPLSESPLRSGRGERKPSAILRTPQACVVMALDLDGDGPASSGPLPGLSDGLWRVTDLGDGTSWVLEAAELASGGLSSPVCSGLWRLDSLDSQPDSSLPSTVR